MANAPLYIYKKRIGKVLGSTQFVTKPELGDTDKLEQITLPSRPADSTTPDQWVIGKFKDEDTIYGYVFWNKKDGNGKDIAYNKFEWLWELDLSSTSLSGEAEAQRKKGELKTIYIQKKST